MREGGGNCLKYLKRGGDTKILKRGGCKLGQTVGTLKRGEGVQLPYELCITSFYKCNQIMALNKDLFPLIWNPLLLISPQSHKFAIGVESVEIL